MISLSWDLRPNRKALGISGQPELFVGDRIRILDCSVYFNDEQIHDNYGGCTGIVTHLYFNSVADPDAEPYAYLVTLDDGKEIVIENWMEGENPVDRWELL